MMQILLKLKIKQQTKESISLLLNITNFFVKYLIKNFKKAKLATNIANFTYNADSDKKVGNLVIKTELKMLQGFEVSYFCGKTHFEDNEHKSFSISSSS